MKCPRCQNEITDDAQFCPSCGLKLEKCPYCHQIVIPGSKYCSSCGKSLQEEKTDYVGGYYDPIDFSSDESFHNETHTVDEEHTHKKKLNKKVIIISVVTLVIVSVLSFIYLGVKPSLSDFISGSQEENTPTITNGAMNIASSTSFSTHTGNINQKGTVYQDGKQIYMCDDNGQLVVMDTKLENQKVLVNEECQYINVTDDYIYYVDKSYHLHRIQKDGTNQETVIDKAVYYVIVKDNKIYYQLDSDKESLYVYDLETKKEKQLNNQSTYNINVTDDCIYYTSKDGIYKIGIDGQGEEKIVSGSIYNMIYQDNKIYYLKEENKTGSLYEYDIKEQKTNEISRDVYAFYNITQQYLFYLNSQGQLQRYDFTSKSEKTIFSGNIEDGQIIGDKLVITTQTNGYGSSETYQVIMDFDGTQQQRLFVKSSGNYI